MENKKILIVEDDPDIRKSMNVRLKASGYDVFVASDVITAVIMARKHEPDLIILDLGLPGGDGFHVIDRLKIVPTLALIPIIIVSGRTGLPNQERAHEAGVQAFLQKPVENAELLAVIRKTLGGPAELQKPAYLSKPARKFLL
jgi:two-component system KDP operon response regulator KdpE